MSVARAALAIPADATRASLVTVVRSTPSSAACQP
jgi:hypothetical protein